MQASSGIMTMAKLAIDNAQWLGDLSEPLKNDIVGIMTRANPCEGSLLLKEGEIIDRFIIVEAGTLIRTKSTEEGGAPLPLDELGAGKVTGFLHVLGHHNDDKVSGISNCFETIILSNAHLLA